MDLRAGHAEVDPGLDRRRVRRRIAQESHVARGQPVVASLQPLVDVANSRIQGSGAFDAPERQN